LPIPTFPWQDVSMGFLFGLLCTTKKHEFILMVGDHFSKMVHFSICTKTTDAFRVAKLYIDEIIKLYGFLQTIVSNKDVRFISYF
jgi:hypothetical protein